MNDKSTVIESRSTEETINAGAELSARLKEGFSVGLVGELGSGKTHFTKGIARGLGITSNIKSPSFTIIDEYRGGELALYHVDLYRLGSSDEGNIGAELDGLGLEEYIYGNGVTIIEWADKAPGLLPELRFVIRFTVTGDNSRRIVIEEKK